MDKSGWRAIYCPDKENLSEYDNTNHPPGVINITGKQVAIQTGEIIFESTIKAKW